MNNRRWHKFESVIIAAVLLAAAAYFFARIPEIIREVDRRYTDLGVVGWSLAVIWILGCFVLMESVTRVCAKRKWSRFCHMEGMAAAALYIFFSAVVLLWVVKGF
ncbi:hypothetical protein SVA_0204 [Sulfurifustis variabilis]|uniref:Uncharacterized protein n=1 Tax=Sulfurifustis variabilis TaxID=1675686 RepID=A0A1B4V033_9GAMM|nr:hypothetical protein [Sulfurifustis variabilis]BAU46786.1 hypothetical protein SVA_0204 [Sulfurifustis variabilis]